MSTDETAEFTYSYKPSVIGAGWSFRLTPAGIAWESGRRSGVTAYRDITKVRMSYRPATMQSNRFETRVWAGRPAFAIVSASWQGMFNQQAASPDYTRFVTELHRRLAASGSSATFEAGTHPFVFFFGILFSSVVGLAVAGLIWRAAGALDWGPVVVLVAMFAFFAWTGFNFFRRNWPTRYRAADPPKALLPD